MIVKLLLILVLYSAVFLITEFFYKRGLKSLFTRKICHFGGAAVSLILPYWFDVKTTIGISIFFAALLWWAKKKKALGSVNTDNGDSQGAALFPLGIMISFVLFVPHQIVIYTGSILILALADGVAGLFGQLYGHKKFYITGEKTYLGSSLFFLATSLILLGLIFYVFGFISWLAIGLAIISALIITLVEAALGKGWDNVAIPMVAGTVIYYLFKFL